jgi:hypothetical protein
LRRRIHEVKLESILDAERLEKEYGIRQVGSLDLGDVVLEHLVDVSHLGKESIAESEKDERMVRYQHSARTRRREK